MDFFSTYSDKFIPEPNSGCWIWLGQINQFGYGRVRLSDGRTQVAHRVSFESAKGDVPAGLCLDHLCRVRCCVNPDHLEPVTPRENIRRGMLARGDNKEAGRCVNGHDMTGSNAQSRVNEGYHVIFCRECARASRLKWRSKQAA